VTTAIIGVGHIGSALAQHLVGAGEEVALAALDKSAAEALAEKLGTFARPDSAEGAIARADTVIFAVWLEQMAQLIAQHKAGLEGKVVVDPSNPLKVVKHDDQKDFVRTLPVNQSAGSVVAARLPETAHYVKAFGSLGAASLASEANREPRVVLFYATDDDVAAAVAERLIRAAGFEPLKAGGIAAAIRLETPGGDLHQWEMNGALLDLDRARALLNAQEGQHECSA
jgi:8-hydroxy-5-deazaflavin:NADPH oxidoreductase